MARFFKFSLFDTNSMLKVGLILTLPAMLTACDGPATVANPFQDTGTLVNDSPAAAGQAERDFEVNLWNNLKTENRCGQCHADISGGQAPYFADPANVNTSYAAALPLVNLSDPSSSLLVTKVEAGHNCWEQFDSVCADSIKSMISNWAGLPSDTTTARAIKLTAPAIKTPGDSKTFPDLADSFEATVHPLLLDHCIACHYEEGLSQQQSPFFANPDASSAYEAVKPKINIDLPSNSLLVQRLLGNHNCWSDCLDDAAEMQLAIEQFADAIPTTQIDQNLITSKALVLLDDGIIASGGNRHEYNMIALWEFKVGTGSTAFDTSGIEPAMNLNLNGNVSWLGAYGLDFSGGKAWADTQSSKKLHDFIKSSGEYTIEAWVIPANVTQEDANMLSLDAGSTSKNFALTQTLYNYNFHNRTALSDTNGDPALSTPNADEVLQSSLQHVVATYDPVTGRQIFVNGELINTPDPITESTSINVWDDTFAFVLGNSSAEGNPWSGKIRLAAVHNKILTDAQIKQNFDAGVGQKYFLLFSIAEQTGIDDSYIKVEVSQFDSFSYLFNQPAFINLNPDWVPGGFTIQKMRIGINGKQAIAGQSFAYLDETISSNSYSADEGQLLSSHGAVIALEKGADSDEFFLTFEFLAGISNTFVEPAPVPPADPADAEPSSDIGVRTFDEINATIAKITGIPVTNTTVNDLYLQYKQQLPTVETIDAFLSSHQMAIAQLALTSCSERVNLDSALPAIQRKLFTDVDFTESAETAFNTLTKRGYAIDPVLNVLLSTDLDTQPDQTETTNLLGANTPQTLDSGSGTYSFDSLITEMTKCPVDGDPHFNEDFPCNPVTDINTVARTAEIVKAICAAAVGSAAMLIQ
ncbi:MAG: LamG domain-containing protein [Gammaproteobacteria bacterium]|nr:LamG domain-containing protein [Gammaproteobacteria bacterium]